MVEKIFWFQYRDVGSPVLMGEVARQYQGLTAAERQQRLQAAAPGHFGLYGGNEPESRKPAFYAFWCYPRHCQYVYLPVVLKNYRAP